MTPEDSRSGLKNQMRIQGEVNENGNGNDYGISHKNNDDDCRQIQEIVC